MIELLKNHPKAAKVVKDYYLEKFLQTLEKEDLPIEFKEHVRQQGMEDEKLAKIIGENPRSLFDVFDENEIYISIFPDSEKFEFRYSIQLKGAKIANIHKQLYKNRKEAELLAIREAFKLLEEKL